MHPPSQVPTVANGTLLAIPGMGPPKPGPSVPTPTVPSHAILRIKRKRTAEPLDALLLEPTWTGTKRLRRGAGPAPKVFRRTRTEASNGEQVVPEPTVTTAPTQQQPKPSSSVVYRVTHAHSHRDKDGTTVVVDVRTTSATPASDMPQGAQAKDPVHPAPVEPSMGAMMTDVPEITDLNGFTAMLQDYLKVAEPDVALQIQADIDQLAPGRYTHPEPVMQLDSSSDEDEDDMVYDVFVSAPPDTVGSSASGAGVSAYSGSRVVAEMPMARLQYDASVHGWDLEGLLLNDAEGWDSDGGANDGVDADSNAEDHFANDYPDEEEEILLRELGQALDEDLESDQEEEMYGGGGGVQSDDASSDEDEDWRYWTRRTAPVKVKRARAPWESEESDDSTDDEGGLD